MVIARSWAEQRVLMRAFAECEDQTRPTITLHGSQLAIGPAGLDPHGEWGIHVEPPVDGRAQELREALQLAAKLLAGSKGNPPRLQDEVSHFEDKATNHWKPASKAEPQVTRPDYYEPAAGKASAGETPVSPAARMARTHFRKTPPFWGNTYDTPELQTKTAPAEALVHGSRRAASSAVPKAQPMPMAQSVAQSVAQSTASAGAGPSKSSRQRRQTFRYSGAVTAQKTVSGPATKNKAAKTVHGFSSAKRQYETYAATAGKTMPLGFKLDDAERRVLDALGKASLSATEVGALLDVEDAMSWMARFMDKLAELGLDLVTPGDDRDGEPTYILTR